MSQAAGEYVLHRNTVELESLWKLHEIYMKQLGYLIHPHIPCASPILKVADAGSGTGIWVLELAKSLPSSCSLTGVDISSDSFPNQSAWPPNVTFRTQSILEPFPEDEIGAYDIVVVRFMLMAYKSKEEWETAIKNLMSLLKPGGYLQWIDIDHMTARIFQSSPGTSRSALEEIYSHCLNMLDNQSDARQLIPEICRQAGMVNISEDVYATDRVTEFRQALAISCTRSARIALRRLCSDPASGWTNEKVSRVIGEAEHEIATGAYVSTDLIIVVARKPLTSR